MVLRRVFTGSFVVDAEAYITVSLFTAALHQAKVHGRSSGISSRIISSVLKMQNELMLAE